MMEVPELCEPYQVLCIGQPCETREGQYCPYFSGLSANAREWFLKVTRHRQGLAFYPELDEFCKGKPFLKVGPGGETWTGISTKHCQPLEMAISPEMSS